jgi:hypothetical protein
VAWDAWLRRPEGLDRAIDSVRSVDELGAAYREAAARGRRSACVDGSPYVVQLGGSVDGTTVDLAARILRADGARQRPKTRLRATGSIRARPGGSALEVRIAPDDRRTAAWALGVPGAAVALMLVAGIPILGVVLVGGLAVPNVLLAIRSGQRFVLRSLSQVEALLEAIAHGG